MTKRIFIKAAMVTLTMVAGCQVQQPANTVAFSRLTGNYWQLWSMVPDGSRAKQITESPSDKRYPVWTKDGRTLLFRTNNNEIFMVNLTTSDEKRLLGSFGLIDSLALSPDGTKLLLARYRTDLQDVSDLWVTTLDGNERRRIPIRDVGLHFDPAWSRDGKQIAFIFGYDAETNELYVMDSNGKNRRKYTNNKALEFLPAFSPDGGSIAYVSDITGDYEIWLMDANGKNRRRLTHSDGIDTKPCWSADGGKIMFVSNRTGQLQIWIMNKDGTGAEQLTSGAPSMDPAWRRE